MPKGGTKMLKKYANLSQLSALLISLLLAAVFTVGIQKAWADEVTLSGKVTDTEGNPVANANIIAHWRPGPADGRPPAGPPASGITSANGSYRITLMPGTYTLEIIPPRGSDLPSKTISDVQVKEDMTLDITLEAGAILSGKVTDADGKPVANAYVDAYGSAYIDAYGSVEPAFGRTSADGSYRINLAPGTYTLNISLPLGSELPTQSVTDVQVDKDMTLDITLKPGFILSGRITNPAGEPVTDVSVNAYKTATGQLSGHGLTSPDGVYRIVLLPGTYTIDLRMFKDSSGYLSQTIKDVQVKQDTTLDIMLKGFTISGRVTDSNGKAMSDVYVTVQKTPIRSHWWWLYEGPTTAPDGSYQVTLGEGKYDLVYVVRLEGVNNVGRRMPDIDLNRDMTLDVTLPPLGEMFEVRGTIRDKDGNKMNDVQISAYDEATHNFSYYISDTEGAYLLVLPAGKYKLTIAPCSVHRIHQFPEQHIEDFVVEGNSVKDITVGELVPTSVEPHGKEAISWGKIKQNTLLQNYPNPFNPDTWIPYRLAKKADVTIGIYNTKGQLTRTLHLGNQKPGMYVTKDKAAHWDGKDSLGQKVASGVYYYTLQAGEFKATRKMVIVK